MEYEVKAIQEVLDILNSIPITGLTNIQKIMQIINLLGTPIKKDGDQPNGI